MPISRGVSFSSSIRLPAACAGRRNFRRRSSISLLWRAGLRYGLADPLDATALTLKHIAQGGIYDHLGGGFSRYSVDAHWLVPHFEKMLYDNALLIELMTELWREGETPLLALRIAETVDWLLREMVVDGGGFAASLDADSEGEEGKFYVWMLAEIEEVLGKEEAALFAEIYDVTAEGNFEGHNIINRLNNLDLKAADVERRLSEMRGNLLERRGGRVRPGFDDKVLADWNGLAIAALAKAADVFVRVDWLEAAERAFDFVCTRMISNGRLFHSYREGKAKAPASAADYANMIKAALALASITGKPDYLSRAREWGEVLDRHYWRAGQGGYYFAADDTDDLILRTITGQDDAVPNANATMVSNLMALFLWTGEEWYRERADAILQAFAGDIAQNVFQHTGLLGAALDMIAPTHIVIVVPDGGEAHELRQTLARVSLPGAVVQEVSEAETLPASSPAHGKRAIDGKPTAYVCIGPQCSAPVTDAVTLIEAVRAARRNAN